MRRLALCLVFLLALCATPFPARSAEPGQTLPPQARLDLDVLRAAYPGAISRLEPGPDGRLDLVLASGQRLPYDDGQTRDAAQALDNPDIRTMLAQIYPLGPVNEASANPAPGFDPGRSRVQALFTALYGHTQAEVRSHCAGVAFDGHAVIFSTRFGAAEALARVWKRIASLLPEHPEFLPILRPLGGTLAWRRIAGTSRLSMHSFAIALDLNPHLPYWRWEKYPDSMPARRQSFPPEILAAFEAEGFIWGGKWASFDLMHFEYRPEIILKARTLAGQATQP